MSYGAPALRWNTPVPPAAAWNLKLRRVIQRVDISDETLLFVPTPGGPVELEAALDRARNQDAQGEPRMKRKAERHAS